MTPSWLIQVWKYKITLVIVLSPLLLLPLPLALPGPESSCGYVIILMAIYWISEAVPLAVTAFLPLILFPLMGVMTSKTISIAYFPDTIWLFIGGLIIAVAVEDSGFHRRIALRVLLLFGTKPGCLMFSFMVTTYILSMWISNTATTAMMLPIVEAVFHELKADEKRKLQNINAFKGVYDNKHVNILEDENSEKIKEHGIEVVVTMDEGNVRKQDNANREVEENDGKQDNANSEEEEKLNMRMDGIIKGITICVPYAASIGGTATLTGTAPNLVLAGQFEVLFPNSTQQLSFGGWFAYAFPGSLMTLLLSYLWLRWLFLGFNIKSLAACTSGCIKTEGEKNAQRVLEKEYQKLGPMRWAEGTVLVLFVSTALLWFFRNPGYIDGWQVIFKAGYVSDGTVAMTMAFLLFILPNERPEFLCNSNTEKKYKEPVKAILDWPTLHRMFPWSVAFLLAGGFGLAKGAVVSGFSAWMGKQLTFLNGIDAWVICLVITIVVCLFTECSSNTATASLFVPILAQLAQILQIHPLYLLIAPVIASSMAFMLPVATPPNAIAFSYGHLRVYDLIKAGWMINLIGIVVITFFINTYGKAFFGLDDFPAWAAIAETVAPTSATNTTLRLQTTPTP